jgi:hypothetical protein
MQAEFKFGRNWPLLQGKRFGGVSEQGITDLFAVP